MSTVLPISSTDKQDLLQYCPIISTLTQNLRSVMYIMDIEGTLLYISPSIKQLLGFEETSFIGTKFWMELMHPEDAYLIEEFYNTADDLTEFKATFRFRKADGSYLMVNNTGSIKRENGQTDYIMGNLQETNATRLFGHTHENPMYYLDQLMTTLGICFYTINSQYQITSRNKLFSDWMLKETGTVYETGDHFFSHHTPPTFETKLSNLFERAFAGEFVQGIITINEHHIHVALSPLLLGDTITEVAVIHLNSTNEASHTDNVHLLKNSLYSIINTSEEHIYTLDKEYRFLSFNEAYRNVYKHYYGVDPELHGRSSTYYEESDTSALLKQDYEIAMSGTRVEKEMVLEDKAIRLIINPIYNAKGKVMGISVNAKDITLLRESIDKLAESEARFKYIVDHVTDIIFQTDNTGNWVYLNKAWEAIMEFDLGETIGTPFFNFLHPDDVEKNQLLFTPLINREKSYCSHEIRYITRSGKIKWIRVFATLLEDSAGNITGTTGTLKDITSEKENSYLYELLSKNVNDLVCLHEVDGTYMYVSPTIQVISGYLPEDLISKKPLDFIHPDDVPVVIKSLGGLHKKNLSGILIEYRFRNKEGDYKWVESNIKSLYDAFYGRTLLVTSSRVIDERKKAEQQMMRALEIEKQLSNLKSKFVAMASHEFRTPMTAIKSCAEIAEMYLQNYEDEMIIKTRDFIRIIDNEVDRLSELINDVLQLSKLESDTQPLTKKETDIEELVRKSIIRQNSLQNDHREARLRVEGSVRKAFIDPTHIGHAIDNLLSNAFKYSTGRNEPEVNLIFRDAELEILVKDYGIGVPVDEQAQIFNSFYRAKNTGTIKGTGIGLVLVHNFISLHKGRVFFESEPMKGSCFHVVLPYSS